MAAAWNFQRSTCTGLGDRVGALLSIAAVAHAYNGTVWTRWCTDPQGVHESNPLFRHYVPQWTGFPWLTLEDLRARFSLPRTVHWAWETKPRRVISDEGDMARTPPTQGINFLPTVGHRVFVAEGEPLRLSAAAFAAAYATVAAEFRPLISTPTLDIVVHMRAWDNNTVAHDRRRRSYCTRMVLRRLADTGLSMGVLSHNHTWALRMLGKRFGGLLLPSQDAWHDMATLLRARRGIVQHADEGWSAFSSVPALARGLPLITTYQGSAKEHRHAFWRRFGTDLVPSTFKSCGELDAFVAAVA